MKRIDLEKQIESIVYKNREAGVAIYSDDNGHKMMVLIEQEKIKDIATQIKNIVYNNYRRRVRVLTKKMEATWRGNETDNV